MARLGNCGGGSNTGSLTSKTGFSEPVYNEKYIQRTIINHLSTSSKDLNDMPHNAAFHQVLHYLLFKGSKTKLCSGPASSVHIFNVWTIIMQRLNIK